MTQQIIVQAYFLAFVCSFGIGGMSWLVRQDRLARDSAALEAVRAE